MILEFIGFFVVVSTSSWIIYSLSKEVYNYFKYRLTIPLDISDAIVSWMLIIIICLAVGAIYLAWIYAPFEIGFTLKIK